MGALKTADNGKPMDKTRMPFQGVSSPPPQGSRFFQGRVYWLIGLAVGGVVMVVAICTAVVYKHRLETLQSRVDVLEQRYVEMESTMKHYVDERLRTIQFQQVNIIFLLSHSPLCSSSPPCLRSWVNPLWTH